MKILHEQYKKVLLGESIDDSYFSSGTVKVAKKATPIKHEVAKTDGVTKTLEGPMEHKAGHHIITGPKGEQYPVTPEKFKTLYDDHKDGTATPKKIVKDAKLADHDGEIKTSWGNLQYKKGQHMIVKHGPGDFGVVENSIFDKTYEKV